MDEIYLTFQRALKALKVAESNFNNEFYPDSINRSYCAIFYAAKALLLKKGISNKTHWNYSPIWFRICYK
ncbi:MAG: HEPN domain-containing protein [Methanobrevibacter sp.]|nr:HEPN domain-containing protein [Methanobrevibacter sp.]